MLPLIDLESEGVMSTSSAPSMLGLTQLSVEYKSGQSALGHHWKILAGDEQQIGRTRRVYHGAGGKIGKRLAVATGLSTAGSVEINVEDAAGDHVATITGKGGERRIATLLTPDGKEIGKASHTAGVDIDLIDAGGTVVGKILTPADTTEAKDDRAGVPFPIEDAAGTKIGELARWRHQPNALPSLTGQLVSDWIGLYNNSENAYEAELTRHRGFSNSAVYSVVLDPAATIAEPLRTLAILSPVLSGYLY
ncbi:MAG: hypothetical protein AAGC46_19885 [Solirubrobacteraceae bacterium]|nr:hypothetical protein [Patulibacter sp.]